MGTFLESENALNLKRIVEQLSFLNKNFERMITEMEKARVKLQDPIVDITLPAIGSTGEIGPKPSDK